MKGKDGKISTEEDKIIKTCMDYLLYRYTRHKGTTNRKPEYVSKNKKLSKKQKRKAECIDNLRPELV